MGSYDDKSQSEAIPEPLQFDRREVMQFVGLAMFYAQCLEGNLVWLATLLSLDERLTEEALTHGSFEHQMKTLGQLVRTCENRFRELGAIEARHPDTGNTIFEDLREALQVRNSLIHGFFVCHKENYLTESGRRTMLKELCAKCSILKERNELVKSFVTLLGESM